MTHGVTEKDVCDCSETYRKQADSLIIFKGCLHILYGVFIKSMHFTFISIQVGNKWTSTNLLRRNIMKALDMIALALVIIGGLNWLLVGLFEFDLVASLFGGQEAMLSKIVYILVGLAALYSLKFFKHINDQYEEPRAATATAGTDSSARTDGRDAEGRVKDPNVNDSVSGTDRAGDPNNPDDPNNPRNRSEK